jgi:demethylspheroidene O-methyltransferase
MGLIADARRALLRLMARPKFQSWASGFPLTRPVALWSTRKVFDLTAGFVYAQTVLALVRLELLEPLLERAIPEAEYARMAGVDPERFRRLVDAAVSLNVLIRTRGGIELGRNGAPLAGNPALRALVEHNALFYRDLADPVGLLRGEVETDLSGYWPYARSGDPRAIDAERVREYSELMAKSQPAITSEILDAIDFADGERLLDVGGGTGAFVLGAARRHPGLRPALFDLPGVAEHARGRLAEAGFGDRVEVHGGDFFADSLPTGFDVVTLVRILHDHDDPDVRVLLPKVRSALRPGGRLVIAEPMSGVPGAGSVGPAYFSLYLLAMGKGRPRTPSELGDFLTEAGFRDVRRLRSRAPVLATLLTARAPG